MSDQLNFRFGLDDGVSGPAKKIKTGLEGLKQGFVDLGKSAKEGASAMGAHFKALGEFNEKLNFSIELFKKFAEPIEMVAEKVFDLGKEFAKATLESAEFAEKSNIAFTAILGSGKAAEETMKNIVGISSKLPITTQNAVGYATSLITGGFKNGDLKTLLTAVSDVGALNPANAQGAQEELVSHLRRIKGEGFLNERSLRSLAGIGINEGKISANIAKYMSIPLSGVREAISKRTVGVDVAIAAILETIKQEEGGKIGNLSNKLAETTGGLLSTIKSRFFEATMSLSEGPGFKALQGFLVNIRDLTDQTSASGKQLKGAIGDTFNAIFTSIFGKFSGAEGQNRILKIFNDIMDVAKQLPAVISAVVGDVGELLSGLLGNTADVKNGWRELFDPTKIAALGPAFREVGSALNAAAGAALTIAEAIGPVLKILGYGAAIGGGASAGFQTGALVGSIFGPVGTAIGSAIGTVAGGIGGYLGADAVGDALSPAEGVPHHAAGGITQSEHTAVVGDGGPELIAPLPPGGLASIGGRSISVGEITVVVQNSAHGEEQELKEQVKEGTLMALQQMLEALNLEAGAGLAA